MLSLAFISAARTSQAAGRGRKLWLLEGVKGFRCAVSPYEEGEGAESQATSGAHSVLQSVSLKCLLALNSAD